MGLKSVMDAIYLAMPKYVTRVGVAADCATQHTVNMFTVAGGDVLLMGIYGKIIFAKDAGAQLLRLGHVPTIGGGEYFLCAASLTTASDVADTIYTISGIPADAMIVLNAQLGGGALMSSATGIGTGTPHVLAPGILRLTTSIANDITGLINWTVLYRPLTDVSRVTVL